MYFDEVNSLPGLRPWKQKEKWKAWALLYEEWLAHNDRDYFDEEMGDEINVKLLELFERSPRWLNNGMNCASRPWRFNSSTPTLRRKTRSRMA